MGAGSVRVALSELAAELHWALGVFLDEALQHIVCPTHGAYFWPLFGSRP